MKGPLGVSPSKANQGTTRGKEKIILTWAGIEPMTSGLHLYVFITANYKPESCCPILNILLCVTCGQHMLESEESLLLFRMLC